MAVGPPSSTALLWKRHLRVALPRSCGQRFGRSIYGKTWAALVRPFTVGSAVRCPFLSANCPVRASVVLWRRWRASFLRGR